jgi:hypothetical protein
MAIDDFEKFAFVVECADSISEMICQYAIFEEIYLQSASSVMGELEAALIRLYASIMIYLAKAKRYFEQNSASWYSYSKLEY